MSRIPPSNRTGDPGEPLEEPGRSPGARDPACRKAAEEAPACAGMPRTQVGVAVGCFLEEAATP